MPEFAPLLGTRPNGVKSATPADVGTGSRTGVAQRAVGVILVVALILWGQIDLAMCWPAGGSPVQLFVLVLLPIGALRWGILLRALAFHALR